MARRWSVLVKNQGQTKYALKRELEELRRKVAALEAKEQEHAQASEILHRQNEYLSAIQETTLALMNRLDLADLLETIIKRAAQLFGTEHGYIYLVNPAKQVLERKVTIGLFNQALPFTLKSGEGLSG